ncbi:hypothetical protein fep_080 [Pigeonpox virus]|uniref:Entry-fusion complex protein OPG086 n=1 Tax=Pigeonpox virus TaxID=10264 RepID=A0A068EGV6_9POXV|nr:hypothetical protein HM89_gp082 [Pigeonpox virus]AID46588.1 hypothetical protein fep_080 [Pigeonpox virus]WCL40029.1 hypothetical protein [Pigeonpox virus]
MTLFLVIFFLLFLLLCYFFSFKRINKMEIGINPIKKIPWSDNEHVFVSSLFTNKDKYLTCPMRLTYKPDSKTAVLNFKGTNYTYHLDNFDDVRKLLPTLLLSK